MQNCKSIAVKSRDTYKKSKSKDSILFLIDAEVRKLGEQRGLDTLVVQVVNNERERWDNSL